jgi:hypothetical protein
LLQNVGYLVELPTFRNTFLQTSQALLARLGWTGEDRLTHFSGTPKTLTSAELQPIVAEAIRRWAAAGLSQAQLTRLRAVQFQVTDLSATVPDEVGTAWAGGVQLDATGVGFGWFVNPTPRNGTKFAGTNHRPGWTCSRS